MTIRSITMRRARTWGWARMHRYDDPYNDLGPSSPYQSCPDCIIATRGYDFREGLGGPPCAAASVRSRHTARRGYAGRERFILLLQFFDPTGSSSPPAVADSSRPLGSLERRTYIRDDILPRPSAFSADQR